MFIILLALLSEYKKTASKEVLKQIHEEIIVQRTNLNLIKRLHSKAEFQSERVSELIGKIVGEGMFLWLYHASFT